MTGVTQRRRWAQCRWARRPPERRSRYEWSCPSGM